MPECHVAIPGKDASSQTRWVTKGEILLAFLAKFMGSRPGQGKWTEASLRLPGTGCLKDHWPSDPALHLSQGRGQASRVG